MKNVVLTGASGFLGQHLLKAILTREDVVEPLHIWALHRGTPELEGAVAELLANVTAAAITTTPQQQLDRQCRVECVNLRNPDSVHSWLQKVEEHDNTKIDVCIHTAALCVPAKCEVDPVAATEINVPSLFFDRLHQHNPSMKIVALSTDQVYGGTKEGMYNEDDLAVPCNHYGRTKLSLEELLQNHPTMADSSICLRSSIILGPKPTLVPAHDTFLHFCASRRTTPTTYYTDEIRSVIAVSDAVKIVLKCANLTLKNNYSVVPPGVYCMGGPMAVSRLDMAVATLTYLLPPEDANGNNSASSLISTLAMAQRKAELPSPAPTNTAVASPLNIAMDSSKLVEALGMTGEMKSLAEIVAQTFESVSPSST